MGRCYRPHQSCGDPRAAVMGTQLLLLCARHVLGHSCQYWRVGDRAGWQGCDWEKELHAVQQMPLWRLVWERQKVVIAGCVRKEDKWCSPCSPLIRDDHDNQGHYWCALACGEQMNEPPTIRLCMRALADWWVYPCFWYSRRIFLVFIRRPSS